MSFLFRMLHTSSSRQRWRTALVTDRASRPRAGWMIVDAEDASGPVANPETTRSALTEGPASPSMKRYIDGSP
jgi:hypothetical protein